MRWQVLGQLGKSDLRVRELAAALGLPQNLVSYHVGRLRAAGVVSAHRSSADGRDSYYTLDLSRCGELLAEAGAALHPGLADGGTAPHRGAPPRPASVLLLCSGNSSRSQMAEALLRTMSAGKVAAFSAGSRPKPVHPAAVRAMSLRGIDISAARPKSLDLYLDQRFDLVISLCDRVREVCPPFPGAARTIHWSVVDPSGVAVDSADPDAAFRATADQLETRLRFLLREIGVAPG